MGKKNTIAGYLYKLDKKKYVCSQALDKYYNNPNKTNLRKVIESQFTQSIEEIKEITHIIWDSFKSRECTWSEDEMITFRYLLRMKGTSTISELSKKSGIDKKKIRDAITGLEEDEGAIESINTFGGNTKLVFISQDYLRKMLNKEDGE